MDLRLESHSSAVWIEGARCRSSSRRCSICCRDSSCSAYGVGARRYPKQRDGHKRHRAPPPTPADVLADWRAQDGIDRGKTYKDAIAAIAGELGTKASELQSRLQQLQNVPAEVLPGSGSIAALARNAARRGFRPVEKMAADRLHQALRSGRLALRLHRGAVRRAEREDICARREPLPLDHERPVRAGSHAGR